MAPGQSNHSQCLETCASTSSADCEHRELRAATEDGVLSHAWYQFRLLMLKAYALLFERLLLTFSSPPLTRGWDLTYARRWLGRGKKKKKIGVFWESSRLVEFWLWLTVRLTALHHSRVCALRKGLYWVLQADFGGIGRAGDLTLSARTLVEKFGDQTFGLLSNLAYLAACTSHVIVIKLKWLTRCCLLCISEEPTMLLGGAGSPAGFEKHPESDKLDRKSVV